MKPHIHCPVNGWDCPYYSNSPIPCQCTLEDPMNECDDFGAMWDPGDDYICTENCYDCSSCNNSDQDTTDKVAFCNCCENYGYYTPRAED